MTSTDMNGGAWRPEQLEVVGAMKLLPGDVVRVPTLGSWWQRNALGGAKYRVAAVHDGRALLVRADLTGWSLRGADWLEQQHGTLLEMARTPRQLGVDLSSILSVQEQNVVLRHALAELALDLESGALGDDSIDMHVFHTCDTTHCIGGWCTHRYPQLLQLVELYIHDFSLHRLFFPSAGRPENAWAWEANAREAARAIRAYLAGASNPWADAQDKPQGAT